MMKAFMDRDFLLTTPAAQRLYHEYAAKMPVVDYHCHISPQEIYENKRFADIAEAWLGGDHYKWRLMRACGVDENLVTGDAPGWEKFAAFAGSLSRSPGNPVYHWAHLELQRYFDVTQPLHPGNAKEIWAHCNRLLQEDEGLRVRGIIGRSNVRTIVTTDDPLDSLEWHEKLRQDESFPVTVLPGWRPDKAVNIDKPEFAAYVGQLAALAGVDITSFSTLCEALGIRMEYFDQRGCRASDHGIESIEYVPANEAQLDAILRRALVGEAVSSAEASAFRFAALRYLGGAYARLGWVMEIHFGVQRNVNSRGFDSLGPDTGYDCIKPADCMQGLSDLLDGLEREDRLPKVLLFSIEPGDNARINTLAGCFQKPGVAGRVQQGSAWWFNDTKEGMQQQLASFAATGVLANFVGMLTDSRSFLSYTRHEYFRRILCSLLGGWVENGEYPGDWQALGAMVQDISYNNAVRFFDFDG